MSTRVVTITLPDRTVTVTSTDPARVVNIGPPGDDGVGVPVGGTTGQVLAKTSGTDYATGWTTPAASGVASVAGKTGVVTLGPTDVGADASGAASTAQAAAIASAASDATTKANAAQAAAIAAAASDATTKANSAQSTAISTAASDATTKASAAQAAAIAASQPLDSDLTAIAALTTTAYGRALLALADAAAGRTAFGLGTAATHASTEYEVAGAAAAAQAASQPLDSDLTAIAALTTTSTGRSLLAAADAAALRAISALGTAAVTNTGTGSSNTILGNDSRLSDSRTPTAHKTTHATGGSDALAASDIGAASSARLVTAGTGLTGGGDLSADRTLTVSFGTTSGTSAQGNDTRIGAPRPIAAKSTQWQLPCHMQTGGAGTFASGTVSFVPIDIAKATTFTDIAMEIITTAQSGGTVVTTLGVYNDDGSYGAPDTVSGPISGSTGATPVLTSTGRKGVTFGTPLALPPGRVWAACAYVESVAPTTKAVPQSITNSVTQVNLNSLTLGTAWRGWAVTGQTGLPTGSVTFTQIGGTSPAAVVIGLKAQ